MAWKAPSGYDSAMDPDEAASRLEALRAEITLKYRVGGSLAQQAKKIRRTLPRYERQQVEALVRVEAALAESDAPEKIDPAAFERAETALQMYLETVDHADQRRGYLLDITTSAFVNVLLGVIALAVLLALVR